MDMELTGIFMSPGGCFLPYTSDGECYRKQLYTTETLLNFKAITLFHHKWTTNSIKKIKHERNKRPHLA